MQQRGLRFLLPYMRPYRQQLLIGSLYALGGASAAAYGPALLGQAIDALTRGVAAGAMLWYALGIVALACMLAVFRYLLRMLTGDIAAGVSYQMTSDLFARMLLFDRQTIADYGVGELLSRGTNDFIYIWRFYSAGFQMSMHALLLLTIGCTLMALVSPLLAAMVIVMLVLSIGAQLAFGRVVERSFDRVQQRLATVSSFAQEHLSAQRMLAAYAQETPTTVAFRRANDELARENLAFVVKSGAISPLPSLVVRISAALVIGIGGAMIVNGDLTLGEYVQFIIYLGLLSGAASSLSMAFERLQQGSAAAGRIGDVLRRVPRIADAPGAVAISARGHLRFEGVSVYSADRQALHDVTIDVPAATTLGIVGATGSGKSTLLALATRVIEPQRGRVLLDGQDLRTVTLASLRRAVAAVPQETLLFSVPLRENIALGLGEIDDARVMDAARAARLTNDLEQLPHGLDTTVGERGTTLSGGQKQRTAIARALVRDPRVLLLDDSLSSVDAATAAEILAELRDARTGRTCLIVSQRIAAVRDADCIVVLDAGRVVEQGTHRELLARDGIYATMYRREVREAEISETSPAAVRP